METIGSSLEKGMKMLSMNIWFFIFAILFAIVMMIAGAACGVYSEKESTSYLERRVKHLEADLRIAQTENRRLRKLLKKSSKKN